MIVPDENGNTELDPVRESAYRWMCALGRLSGGHAVNVIFNAKANNEKPTTIQSIKDQSVLDALDKCNWNRGKAAKLLGINQSTIWRTLARLGLNKRTTNII